MRGGSGGFEEGWGKKWTGLPPPCESNTKFPKVDGNTTSCCSDTGVVCARREKTREATDAPRMYRSSGDAPISTSKGQEGGEHGWQGSNQCP